MTKQPAVYILASKQNGTLYIGVTSDLKKRAWTHKNDLVEGFTKNTEFTFWFTTSYTAIWFQR
jgi:putative endonuclease